MPANTPSRPEACHRLPNPGPRACADAESVQNREATEEAEHGWVEHVAEAGDLTLGSSTPDPSRRTPFVDAMLTSTQQAMRP
jgi:hypothetical protein